LWKAVALKGLTVVLMIELMVVTPAVALRWGTNPVAQMMATARR
jgi:hypothetical protein